MTDGSKIQGGGGDGAKGGGGGGGGDAQEIQFLSVSIDLMRISYYGTSNGV